MVDSDSNGAGLPVLNNENPRLGLDYFVEARNGRKRSYIYDYKKSRTCPHPNLIALNIGGNWYRCTKCNYAFDIVTAYQQPLHNLVIGGLLNAMHFAKEYGGHALGEVLRRPNGQADGSPHKPVLPEGMSFVDAIAALETVDVNSPDGGQEQLKEVLDLLWVGPKEKREQLENTRRMQKKKELEGRADEQGKTKGELPPVREHRGRGDTKRNTRGRGKAGL
jgi:hypothetical protein